jgi:hypothetical protein
LTQQQHKAGIITNNVVTLLTFIHLHHNQLPNPNKNCPAKRRVLSSQRSDIPPLPHNAQKGSM